MQNLDNLSVSTLQKIKTVLEKIKTNSELCNRRTFLFGKIRESKEVSEDDFLEIIKGLIKNKVVKGSKWLMALSDYYFISIDQPFFDYLEKVNLKLEKPKKIIEKINQPFFDSEKSVLHLLNQEIKIARQQRKTYEHDILEHIFIDNAEDLTQEFAYSFILADKFGVDIKDKEDSWRVCHTACLSLQEKIRKGTREKIDDFLIFSTGKKGSVKINPKYLLVKEKTPI